ncbi:hypothetical protein CCP3SC1_660019 [Gammaproteobacteria bacterium]
MGFFHGQAPESEKLLTVYIVLCQRHDTLPSAGRFTRNQNNLLVMVTEEMFL